MGYVSFLEGSGFNWRIRAVDMLWITFFQSSALYCNWGILLWCPQFWHVLVRFNVCSCLDITCKHMHALRSYQYFLGFFLPQSLCENMPNRAEETMVTLGMSAHTDRLLKLMVENGVTNTAVMERLNGEPWVMSCLGFWVEGGVSFCPTPHMYIYIYCIYIYEKLHMMSIT